MTKLEALLQEAESWAHEAEIDRGETGGTKLFRQLIDALYTVRMHCYAPRRHGSDRLGAIDRGWNQALACISGAVENGLAGRVNPGRSERRAHLAELTRLSEEYGLYDHEKPVEIPTPDFRLKRLESWCARMGLDIQRVVSLLGTTSLAGYYDGAHSTKKAHDVVSGEAK